MRLKLDENMGRREAAPIRLRWSPDSRFFLANGDDNKGRSGLYKIDAQTGEVSAVVPQERAISKDPDCARDGLEESSSSRSG